MKIFIGVLTLMISAVPAFAQSSGPLDPHEKYLLQEPIANIDDGELNSDRNALIRASHRLERLQKAHKAEIQDYIQWSKVSEDTIHALTDGANLIDTKIPYYAKPVTNKYAQEYKAYFDKVDANIAGIKKLNLYSKAVEAFDVKVKLTKIRFCHELYEDSERTKFNGSILLRINILDCPTDKIKTEEIQADLIALDLKNVQALNLLQSQNTEALEHLEHLKKAKALIEASAAINEKLTLISNRMDGTPSAAQGPLAIIVPLSGTTSH